MSFVKTFTDPQGVTHTNAYFEVAYASKRNDNSDSYTLDIKETVDAAGVVTGFTYTPTTNANSFSNVDYRMYYWTNKAAKTAGNMPYVLASKSPIGEVHNAQNLDATYATLTAMAAAEKHCQAVVLV